MILPLTFASPEEQELFEHIYRQYKNLLIYKAREILRDQMLAEDAASEAFIRIYKNLHKIDDPSSNASVAFYVTIVRNVALTMVKNEKSYDEVPETVDAGVDLENVVVSKLTEESIYRMVEQLGEELKSVFLLKYAYDLSHREIGRLLEISENNVTVRLHRARKRLQEIIRREGIA